MEEDDLDGCDVDFTEDQLAPEESDLFVLFADALDPETPTTVEDAEADWLALFGGAT